MKRIPPFDGSVHRGDLQGIASHRITSIGDGVGALRKPLQKSKSPWGRNVTPAGSEKHPPSGRKPASGGCFHLYVVVGKHFRIQSENAPYPLVESGDPFWERGLGLLSFGIFSLQKQRKGHQKTLISIKLHSKFPKQKLPFTIDFPKNLDSLGIVWYDVHSSQIEIWRKST